MNSPQNEHEPPLLATIFRDAIKRSRFGNQAELCKKPKPGENGEWLGITPSLLSDYLNGKRSAPLEIIVRLARLTGVSLTEAVIAACVVRAKREASSEKGRAISEIGDAVDALTKVLESVQSTTAPLIRRDYVSLEDFPNYAPGGWKIVVGDRREVPPQGLGDLMALSMSSSDVMFLPGLRFPPGTPVISDKSFRLADEDDLRRLLKCNILAIGSPAVCLGTREILRRVGATFLFNIGSEDFSEEARIIEGIESDERHDPQSLASYANRPDIQKSAEALLTTFRSNGFVDPVDFEDIRGRAIPRNIDYGLIALARNPWSDEHLVCICAGVHSPGTAGAVQMLAHRTKFEKHPWGGVIRVQVSDQARWEERFNHLNPKWETHDYSPESYLQQLSYLRESLETSEGRVRKNQVKISAEMFSSVESFAANRLHLRFQSHHKQA